MSKEIRDANPFPESELDALLDLEQSEHNLQRILASPVMRPPGERRWPRSRRKWRTRIALGSGVAALGATATILAGALPSGAPSAIEVLDRAAAAANEPGVVYHYKSVTNWYGRRPGEGASPREGIPAVPSAISEEGWTFGGEGDFRAARALQHYDDGGRQCTFERSLRNDPDGEAHHEFFDSCDNRLQRDHSKGWIEGDGMTMLASTYERATRNEGGLTIKPEKVDVDGQLAYEISYDKVGLTIWVNSDTYLPVKQVITDPTDSDPSSHVETRWTVMERLARGDVDDRVFRMSEHPGAKVVDRRLDGDSRPDLDDDVRSDDK